MPLPTGLSMDTSGNITGTPTTAQTVDVSFRAANGVGADAISGTEHVTVAALGPPDLRPIALIAPATIHVGDTVTFGVRIRNDGATATPAGQVLDFVCEIAGGVTNVWSDNNSTSLAAAAERVQSANGGSDSPFDGTYVIPNVSTLSVTVRVNTGAPGRPPITESDTTNNDLTVVLTILPSGGGGTAPAFTSANPPDGTVGTTYTSGTTIAFTGSPTPTITLNAGTLPPGLTLSSAGVITGTPTTPGTYSGINLKAHNGVGSDAISATFDIAIASSTLAEQPLVAWLGTYDVAEVNSSGEPVRSSNMNSFGIQGFAHSLGHAVWTPDSWIPPQWQTARANGCTYVGVGMNIGEWTAEYGPVSQLGPPRTSTQRADYISAWTSMVPIINSHAGNFTALDTEPYGWNSTSIKWEGTEAERAGFRTFGHNLGNVMKVIGPIVVYMSSDAAWPGSNYDQIAYALGSWTDPGVPNTYPPGETSYYAHNMFPDFVWGLLDSGATVVLSDASFSFAVQNPAAAGSPYTGIDIHRTNVASTFPVANAQASAFIWPDNTDIVPPRLWPRATVAAYVEADTEHSSGYALLYQDSLIGSAGSNVPANQAAYWIPTGLPGVHDGVLA